MAPPGLVPLAPETEAQDCPECAQSGRTCRSCQRLRRRALRLVDVEGLSIEQAAARMTLSHSVVRALADAERDRHELARFKLDTIPTARARAFLAHEMARDNALTRAEVAQRMNMHQSDFDRQFGYAKSKQGAVQERVGIPAASRLALALGRAPRELDGC